MDFAKVVNYDVACSLMEQIVPAFVRSDEAFCDRSDIRLFPEEESVIERAVEKRRREFTTVRACARQALASMGILPSPIVPGLRGAPNWPRSIVGSMTHCDGYCAASVAREADVESIGIDAEPNTPLPDGVLQTILVSEDLPSMERVASTGVAADRLLFSAKESVYKAWFPLAQRWLGFDDVTVTLRTDGTFTARLLVDGVIHSGRRLASLEGRWLAARGLVVTAITVVPPERRFSS